MNIQINRGLRSWACTRDDVAAPGENKAQMKTIGSTEVFEAGNRRREGCEGEAAFDGKKRCMEGHGQSLKSQACAMGAHKVAQGLLAPGLGLEHSTNPRCSLVPKFPDT